MLMRKCGQSAVHLRGKGQSCPPGFWSQGNPSEKEIRSCVHGTWIQAFHSLAQAKVMHTTTGYIQKVAWCTHKSELPKEKSQVDLSLTVSSSSSSSRGPRGLLCVTPLVFIPCFSDPGGWGGDVSKANLLTKPLPQKLWLILQLNRRATSTVPGFCFFWSQRSHVGVTTLEITIWRLFLPRQEHTGPF